MTSTRPGMEVDTNTDKEGKIGRDKDICNFQVSSTRSRAKVAGEIKNGAEDEIFGEFHA